MLTIAELNELGYEEFIARLSNVVEHCALCAASVWRFRPFRDLGHLQACMEDFLDQIPLSGKEGVLRLHPDLAGKMAAQGQLTQESTNEQAAAGLHHMTSEERQKMADMNSEYVTKFGFPFVICARENKKAAILSALGCRLQNTGEQEAVAGVNEVKKICLLRLQDIIAEHSS